MTGMRPQPSFFQACGKTGGCESRGSGYNAAQSLLHDTDQCNAQPVGRSRNGHSFLGAGGGVDLRVAAVEDVPLVSPGAHANGFFGHQSPDRRSVAESAVARNLFRVHGWSLARSRGGANEACVNGHFAGGDFVDHGDWRVPGALEFACAGAGHILGACGCASRAAFGALGTARRMPLGGSEHTNDLRDSRCGLEHRISFVEFEQSDRNSLGILAVQRTAAGGMAALGWRGWWNGGVVRWRRDAGSRFIANWE